MAAILFFSQRTNTRISSVQDDYIAATRPVLLSDAATVCVSEPFAAVEYPAANVSNAAVAGADQ